MSVDVMAFASLTDAVPDSRYEKLIKKCIVTDGEKVCYKV